jgi:hypothetical protein
MDSKEIDKVQKVKIQNKFWTGFVFGLGFSLAVLIIFFFIIGVAALIINNISPGLLF